MKKNLRELPKDEDQTKPVARVLFYYFSEKELNKYLIWHLRIPERTEAITMAAAGRADLKAEYTLVKCLQSQTASDIRTMMITAILLSCDSCCSSLCHHRIFYNCRPQLSHTVAKYTCAYTMQWTIMHWRHRRHNILPNLFCKPPGTLPDIEVNFT